VVLLHGTDTERITPKLNKKLDSGCSQIIITVIFLTTNK